MIELRNPTERILSLVGIGTVLSLAYSIFNYAVQITLVELFGYHLRGIFEILMSIVGLVSIIFSFNFYTAINLYISKNLAVPSNLKKISLQILSVQIAAIFTIYLVSNKTEAISNELQPYILVVLFLATALTHKVNEFTAVLNGHHYFIEAKLLALYGSIFTAMIIGVLYVLGFRDENLIVCVAVIGPFTGSYIYSMILTKKQKNLTKKSGTLNIGSLYIENRAIYIISLSQFISIKLYLLFIAHNESIEIVGIFSLAYSIIQFILLPATFLATIVLSNRSESLGGLLKSFKVLFAYGVLSAICLNISIHFGLLQILHLKSFQNPIFIKVLDVMALSLPFSVLNILVVATAIRKNLCSKVFVLAQMLLIPVIIIVYCIVNTMFALEVAVSGAYVLTWIFASSISFYALKRQLTEKAGS